MTEGEVRSVVALAASDRELAIGLYELAFGLPLYGQEAEAMVSKASAMIAGYRMKRCSPKITYGESAALEETPPAGKSSVGPRVWRKLPRLFNGKPQWTLRDDDAEHLVGTIWWDSDAPGAWVPSFGKCTPNLNEAMDQVERHIGVFGAVRPSEAAQPAVADRGPDQQRTFERSGKVTSDDPLVGFLYLLMRDEVPVGTVARCARELTTPMTFTNGWLAEYAKDIAGRLRNADLEALGRLERTVLTAGRTVLREALQAIVAARIIPDGKKSVPIERLTEAVDRAAALLNRG